MRLLNGIISGGVLLLAGVLLCRVQGVGAPLSTLVAGAGLLTGILAALLAGRGIEGQDRLAFVSTVFLLFTLMLWLIAMMATPLLAGWLAPTPERLRALLVPVLGPSIAALVLYWLSSRLLGFDRVDLHLTPAPRVRWSLALPALAALGGLAALEARFQVLTMIHPGPDPEGGWTGWILIAIGIGFEEFFYRGFLLAALRDRVGVGWAIGLQAILFALAGGLAAGAPGPALALRFGVGAVAGGAVVGCGHLAPGWVVRVIGRLLAYVIW